MLNLVFENDEKFDDIMSRYVRVLFEPTIVFNVGDVDTDKILELFSTHDVLHYKPTQISPGQHNLLMMAMYKLLKQGKLQIKQVNIIHNGDHYRLQNELKAIWSHQHKYLEEVLKQVIVYAVDQSPEPGVKWMTKLEL